MKRFSIIVTPHNGKELSNFIPMFKFIPRTLLFMFLRILPPFKIGKIILKSKLDIQGDIILCPIKDEREMPSASSFKRLLKAMHLAQKNGPSIIGLGNTNSYNNSNYGRLNKILNLKVITGEYLNAVNALNMIKNLRFNHLKNEETCKILVIGNLTDDFSVFYLELISSIYKEIMLFDFDNIRLPKILNRIIYETGTIIKPVKEREKAIKEADLIIVTSHDAIEINSSWLKSNAIVNLLVENQKLMKEIAFNRDIKIVAGGGLIEIENAEIKGVCLNNKQVYPWVAETILNLLDIKLKTNQNLDRLSVRIAQKTYRSAIKNNLIRSS